jgi:hypothetical protein
LKPLADDVTAGMNAIAETTMHLGAIGMGGDHDRYISYATPYLRAFSQMTLAWLQLWQAEVAARKLAEGGRHDEAYLKGKIATARYYITTFTPYTLTMCNNIKAGADTAIDFQEEWFGVATEAMA